MTGCPSDFNTAQSNWFQIDTRDKGSIFGDIPFNTNNFGDANIFSCSQFELAGALWIQPIGFNPAFLIFILCDNDAITFIRVFVFNLFDHFYHTGFSQHPRFNKKTFRPFKSPSIQLQKFILLSFPTAVFLRNNRICNKVSVFSKRCIADFCIQLTRTGISAVLICFPGFVVQFFQAILNIGSGDNDFPTDIDNFIFGINVRGETNPITNFLLIVHGDQMSGDVLPLKPIATAIRLCKIAIAIFKQAGNPI